MTRSPCTSVLLVLLIALASCGGKTANSDVSITSSGGGSAALASTGGVTSRHTGGSAAAGVGGIFSGTGGSLAGTGGTFASGGAFAGTGGSLAVSGGTFAGTGGKTAHNCAGAPSRMPTPRAGLSATTGPDGRIYLLGGQTQYGTAPDTVPLDAYDPTDDSYSSLASLPAAINDYYPPSIAFAGDHLVVCDSNRLWLYDPSTNSWSEGSAPPFAYGAAAGLSGSAYFFNGNVAAAYDPGTDSWSSLPTMPFGENFMSAVSIGGKIYVIGQDARVAVYDPTVSSWSQLPSPLPQGTPNLGAVGDAKGRFWSIGNYNIFIFDPVAGSWIMGPPIPVKAPQSAGAAACGGTRMFVFGGLQSDGVTDLVQAYGPGDQWSVSP